MSIKTLKNQKFSFIGDNGIEQVAPANSDIYVHVTDNGNGKHEVHGKVRKEVVNGESVTMEEIGWHRVYSEDGSIASLPSNAPDLLGAATALVIASIKKVNPNIEFIA